MGYDALQTAGIVGMQVYLKPLFSMHRPEYRGHNAYGVCAVLHLFALLGRRKFRCFAVYIGGPVPGVLFLGDILFLAR